MAKSKEGREDEFFKSQIRNLKKENKRLKQQIRNLEKQMMLKTDSEPEEKHIKVIDRCTNCGKGELQQMELVGRIFEICNLCDYRKKLSKVFKRRGRQKRL